MRSWRLYVSLACLLVVTSCGRDPQDHTKAKPGLNTEDDQQPGNKPLIIPQAKVSGRVGELLSERGPDMIDGLPHFVREYAIDRLHLQDNGDNIEHLDLADAAVALLLSPRPSACRFPSQTVSINVNTESVYFFASEKTAGSHQCQDFLQALHGQDLHLQLSDVPMSTKDGRKGVVHSVVIDLQAN